MVNFNLSSLVSLLCFIAPFCDSSRPQLNSKGFTVSISKGTPIDPLSPLSSAVIFPNVYKPLKLPVWPVVGGVVSQLLEWANQPKLAEKWADLVGGRVVPCSLSDLPGASPFLLLVHHKHSFTPFDPFRSITNLLLPEGFPAHPHSGFDTLTYTIKGGLAHRDSEGVKMSYGDGDAQWMRAGRGVIHEEMWDIPKDKFREIEIFQLWLNLPSGQKDGYPFVRHILAEEMTDFSEETLGLSARLICGKVAVKADGRDRKVVIGEGEEKGEEDGIRTNVFDGPGTDTAGSPMMLMHISLRPNAEICLDVPRGSSTLSYVRRGSMRVGNDDNDSDDNELRYGSLCSFTSRETSVNDFGPNDSLEGTGYCKAFIRAGSEGLDSLILVGSPISERVIMSGPFVLSSERDYERKARAFNSIGSSGFWDYRLSDKEWRDHLDRLKLQDVLDQF